MTPPFMIGLTGPLGTPVLLDGMDFLTLGPSRPKTPSSAPSRTAAGGEPPSPVSAPAGTPDSPSASAGEGSADGA